MSFYDDSRPLRRAIEKLQCRNLVCPVKSECLFAYALTKHAPVKVRIFVRRETLRLVKEHQCAVNGCSLGNQKRAAK